MRISDWSSDVCSSDLHDTAQLLARGQIREFEYRQLCGQLERDLPLEKPSIRTARRKSAHGDAVIHGESVAGGAERGDHTVDRSVPPLLGPDAVDGAVDQAPPAAVHPLGAARHLDHPRL